MINKILDDFEAAGGYVESSTFVKQQEPVTAYCTGCGVANHISMTMNVPTRGRCTCSWRCCEAAQPGNEPHNFHWGYRVATPEDFEVCRAKGRDFSKGYPE